MSARIMNGLVICFMLAIGTTASAFAGNVPDAAKSCFDCHGHKGVSTHKEIPTIAGMSEFYLDGQIMAYQKGERPCPKAKFPEDSAKPATDMCIVAKKLSPADSAAVVKYFASQQFVPAVQATDPKAVAVGKKIHSEECELCHTDGGSVADDDAGILAGQWIPYLQETFKEYQSGKRQIPEKMKPKITALTPDQIHALVQYYASEGKK